MFSKPAIYPTKRAPFDVWLYERRLNVADVAAKMGLAQAVLCRAMLPVENKNFRAASVATRLKVKAFTDGAITLDDWPENPLPRQEPGFPSPDAPVPSAVIANAADGTFSHERAA